MMTVYDQVREQRRTNFMYLTALLTVTYQRQSPAPKVARLLAYPYYLAKLLCYPIQRAKWSRPAHSLGGVEAAATSGTVREQVEALQAAIHEYMDALGQQDLAKSLARLRDDLDAKHQTTLAAHEGLRSELVQEQAALAAQLEDLAQQLNGSKSPKIGSPGGGLRRQVRLRRIVSRFTGVV